MNARGGGLLSSDGTCAPWGTGHSDQSGLTDAVDVPASLVLAATSLASTRCACFTIPEFPQDPCRVQDYGA
jgi:hypothetical protein